MKNNKLKKVLIIILVSLLALLGIFILVSFIVNKDGTLYWINYFVDLLNKPLPIVGVTTLAVLIFVWRLIVSTNYGQKVISGLRQELNSIKAEHEQYKIDSENEKAELKQENAILREQVSKGFSLSTNKKIQEYGKELLEYGKGKETIDIETKEQ